MKSRLPRFNRAAEIAPMQLEERDRQIIRLVHRHRFLRSHQIIALVGSSPQQLSRRLKLLYHHGYFFDTAWSPPIPFLSKLAPMAPATC
jgi:hypothetical protein